MRLTSLALAAAAVTCWVLPAPGQQRPLKVLVLYDMEGVSGATRYEHTNSLHPNEYAVGRASLTDDVNAAIRGLRAGGATDNVLVDGHGSENENGPDVLEDRVLPPAKLLFRDAPFDQYTDGYDQSFDAIVAIGMHAGAANSAGFLAHTYTSEAVRYEVNGVPFNESMLVAALAARMLVPVIMVSGDDQLEKEVRRFMPWARYATVKRAVDLARAESVDRAEASRRIETAARDALRALADARLPDWRGPYRFTLTFQDEAQAAAAAKVGDAAAVGPRTVEVRSEQFDDGYRASVRLLEMAMLVGWSTALDAVLAAEPNGTPPRVRATQWWYDRYLGRLPPMLTGGVARRYWGSR